MKSLRTFFENYMKEYAEYYVASQPRYWCSTARFETADDQNKRS